MNTVLYPRHGFQSAGFFTLLLLCISGASRAADAPQTFSSTEYGYSVQIPAGWHKVSDASVQKGLAAAAISDPAKRGVVWEAVYQQPAEGAPGIFGYPHLICQIAPYAGGKRPSEAEIAETVKAMTAMFVTSGPTTIAVPAARYDAVTHIAWQPREKTSPGGTFKGFAVMHYGTKALVSIMCYDTAASFPTDKRELDQIQSSFKFTAAAAYVPADADQHLPAAVLMQTGEGDLTFTERSPLSSRKEIAARMAMKEADLGQDYDLANRPFKVYVPQNYDPAIPHGVFVYLGYKDSQTLPAEWEPVLDKAHLIFITPVNHHGDDFPNSIPLWQTMGLALDAVHNLRKLYNVDEHRTYCMGKIGSMQVAMAVADVFTGMIVTGDDSWCEQMMLPGRKSYYKQAFAPPPPAILRQAKHRPIVLGTEIMGDPDSSWRIRTAVMKREGFEHILEIQLTWLGDLHYPHMKVEWFEKSALPFLDSIAAADATKPQTAKTAKADAPAATRPATPGSGASATPVTPATPPAPASSADAKKLLTMAQLYIDSRQPKRAREKLELLLSRYPNDPAAAKAKELLSTLPGE